MAELFVRAALADGTENTSPYETWAKAATSLQTALTAASGGSDVVIIQYNAVPSGDAEVGADTTYTTANSVTIISAANDGGSDYTPTAMWSGSGDPAYWIGNSTAARSVILAPGNDDRVYVYGLCFRTASTGTKNIGLNTNSTGSDTTFESCYFWSGNTDSASRIRVSYGNSSMNRNEFINCQFRLGQASQAVDCSGFADFYECTFAGQGTVPTSGLLVHGAAYSGQFRFTGCDFSGLGSNAIVANTGSTNEFVFERCKFGTSFSVLATQTSNPTRSSSSAYVYDCHSGDTHLNFGYYDALGSVIIDSGTYLTATDAKSNAAACSWKITTTANANFLMPFKTPWIDLYHSGTSEITPYLECLRNDGTATKWNDDDVYAEFTAKTTSGSTKSTGLTSDRKSIDGDAAAAAQADGAGTGSWTIASSNSPASFKIDSGSSLIPAEIGYIRGRICVNGDGGVRTIYVDPQIRT